ncbi:MAG TPA: hypothetical protein PK696_04515 [bacterium]|nr:hypothetical protein [Chlamydiota bacterium]HOE26942.1 hypothetical protein [bacterium]HQM52404.1 hypothetical protein [bacterium]
MPPQLAWILEWITPVSLVLLAAAVFLHARQVRRRLDRLNIEELSRRVAALSAQSEEHGRDLAVCGRDCAELKMRLAAAEGELAQVKEESARFLGIFKTVLYGFDYIVQGCKSALEVGPGGQPPGEKRIAAE